MARHTKKIAKRVVKASAPRGVAKAPARVPRRSVLLALLFALGGIGLTEVRRAEAVGVTTGPTPTDTVMRPDGGAAYVLNSGNSTLTVVDPATNLPVVTIALAQPPNTCKDIDWSVPTQRVLVGCNNGTVLSVDPATSIVLIAIMNPAANYSVISADNWLAGTLGWGFDGVSGWIHQFTGGFWVPAAAMVIPTPVEMVEKRTTPGAPTAQDGFLPTLGNGFGLGTAVVENFDRTTMLAGPPVVWAGPAIIGTGITTATSPDAYVTANSFTGVGYLLRVPLVPVAFAAVPVDTYTVNAVLDVSIAGAFITTLLSNAPAMGAKIAFYDAGNPAMILKAGTLPISATTNPFGGLSTWMGAGETIDETFMVYADVTANATADTFVNIRSTFVDVPPGNVTANLEPVITPTSYGIFGQEARPCHDCGGQTPGVTSGPIFGDGYVAPYSASVGSVQYASGEEVLRLPLFSVPGVGQDAPFVLSYRSRRDFDYRYGQGWFLNQDARLIQQPNSDKNYYDGSGRIDTYQFQPGGSYTSPRFFDTTLTSGGSTTTVTDRFGAASTFDASGYRQSVADRYGNAVTYTYASDKLTTVTDTLSRNYSLSYDSTGRLSSVSDFGGRTWAMAYDYMGNLRKVTTPASTQFPSGRTKWFGYRPNSATWVRGNLIKAYNGKQEDMQTIVYDGNDLVTGETIGGGSYQFAYDGNNNTRTVTDRSGNTTTWTFDQTTAMVTQIEQFTRGLRTGEPASYVTTYTLGTNGYVQTAVLPRGNRLDYTYDSSLNVTEIREKQTNTSSTSSSDIVHQFQFGAYSQPTQYTDPLGNVTTYTVSSAGDTTAITHPTITSPATQTASETLSYDSRGRVTSATDAESRQVDLEYYTSGSHTGYLKSVKRDPSGLALTTTFDYDQYGNVTSITDPRGQTTTLTVDAENYVTNVNSPSAFSYEGKFTYDANRSVTKVEVKNVDRQGNVDATTPWIDTTMAYDTAGRVLSKTQRQTSSLTATTAYEYDGSGVPTKVTTAEGSQTKYEWDERGLLFKATRGYGTSYATTVQVDYDLNGQKAKFTNARGKETLYTHDLFGRPDSVTNELGNYVTVTYDKAGNVTDTQAFDASAVLQAATYNYFDERNQLWQVIESRFGGGLTGSYPTTTIYRDKTGRVTQVDDPLSNSSYQSYDAAGRVSASIDAAGNQTSLTYDENGNVLSAASTEVPTVGSSETFTTEFVYDELNRLITKREIDRTNSSNVLLTAFEYDSRGNLTFKTDAEGHPVRWTYDLANRLTKRERALSLGTTIDDFTTKIEENFTYDKDSRVTGLVDDNYNATGYDIDALNRSTKVTYADNKYVTLTYNANDLVAAWTDQNGTVVTNSYDDRDRLVGRSVTRGTGVQGTTAETYTYDALDRVLTAVDDDYQVENTWDSVGNLLQEKQGYNSSGNEHWKTVNRTYSDAGALANITYPAGFSLSHTRDAIYRLTALVDDNAAVNIATFAYQGVSRLQKTTNQNGTSTEFSYDGFARVSTIDHKLSGGGSLHKFDYAYDKAHNRRMEKNTFDATWVATLPSAVQTFLNGRGGKGDVYAYDMAYRLVDARYDVTNPLTEVSSPGSQAFVTGVAYTLDGLGNRSQVATTVPPGSPTTVTYSTDVVNQYTQVGSTSRSHDDNGNVSDDGTHLFKYDYRNHITEVLLKSTSASVATYRYDAFGRRVEKAVAGGTTTRYVLSGQEAIEEYDGSNAWQAQYVYEDGIDRPRTMDRADIADVDGDSNTSEVLRFTYHQNVVGSVTELTAPAGSIVEWVTYDAYGLPTLRDRQGSTPTQSALGNPYLFTGRDFDPECGLYFFRSRSYDPAIGRFLQRDSAGYANGLSLYEYVSCSPLTFTDPRGRSKLSDAYVKYQKALSKVADIKKQIEDLKAKIVTLEGELRAINAEIDELDNEALGRGKGLCREYTPYGEEHRKDLEARAAALKAQIEQLKARVKQLETDLGVAQGAATEACNAYLDQLASDKSDDGGGTKEGGKINNQSKSPVQPLPGQSEDVDKAREDAATDALAAAAKKALEAAVGKDSAAAVVAAMKAIVYGGASAGVFDPGVTSSILKQSGNIFHTSTSTGPLTFGIGLDIGGDSSKAYAKVTGTLDFDLGHGATFGPFVSYDSADNLTFGLHLEVPFGK